MRKPIIHTQAGLFFAGICLLLTGCSTQPLPGAISKDKYFEQGVEARAHSKGTVSQLGLALAGGGTKAADFSIGVLQGLTEAGVMDRVDAVSTVSGGGYAALWYFSRLLDQNELPKNTSGQIERNTISKLLFRDCLPYRYENWNFVLKEHLPPNDPSSGTCPLEASNFSTPPPEGFDRDQVRFQNHLRGYQDVFAWPWPKPFRYKETSDWGDKALISTEFIMTSLFTLGATAVNAVPNIVFDWEIPLSSSRFQYESGIVRTYGATPTKCNNSADCTSRPLGDEDWVLNRLTFKRLKEEYEKGTIPLWIISATAGENRDFFSPLFFPGQKPFQLTSFEFSPYGSGSGLFSYSTEPLGQLPPWKAVTSSAAFLDSQQKVFPPIVNPFLKLLTLDWGRSLPNPHVSLSENAFHKFLPFPLYLLHGRSGLWHGGPGDRPDDFVNVRLSDGGQSENLGAYALIQRGIKDNIISDHSEDRGGSMADVCRLKIGLAKDQGKQAALYVYFPGLVGLDLICIPDLSMGYDIFQWEHLIVLGCVTSDPHNTGCADSSANTGHHFQRLYLIKPGLPRASAQSPYSLGKALAASAEQCTNGATKNCTKSIRTACTVISAGEAYRYAESETPNSFDSWPYEDYVSCELLAFMMINAYSEEGINPVDQCLGMPQSSTAGITANSSPYLYGAYKELARYYARQLGWFFGTDSHGKVVDENIKALRYRNALNYQMLHPLSPQPKVSGSLLHPLTSTKSGRVCKNGVYAGAPEH